MESQHPAELRVVKRVRMMGVKVTLFLLTVSKGAINTKGTLLDGDFPSSILLAALLPPEPDDDDEDELFLSPSPRSLLDEGQDIGVTRAVTDLTM